MNSGFVASSGGRWNPPAQAQQWPLTRRLRIAFSPASPGVGTQPSWPCWPHTNTDLSPDTPSLPKLLLDWLPDRQAVVRVLVDNPERLYGF